MGWSFLGLGMRLFLFLFLFLFLSLLPQSTQRPLSKNHQLRKTVTKMQADLQNQMAGRFKKDPQISLKREREDHDRKRNEKQITPQKREKREKEEKSLQQICQEQNFDKRINKPLSSSSSPSSFVLNSQTILVSLCSPIESCDGGFICAKEENKIPIPLAKNFSRISSSEKQTSLLYENGYYCFRRFYQTKILFTCQPAWPLEIKSVSFSGCRVLIQMKCDLQLLKDPNFPRQQLSQEEGCVAHGIDKQNSLMEWGDFVVEYSRFQFYLNLCQDLKVEGCEESRVCVKEKHSKKGVSFGKGPLLIYPPVDKDVVAVDFENGSIDGCDGLSRYTRVELHCKERGVKPFIQSISEVSLCVFLIKLSCDQEIAPDPIFSLPSMSIYGNF